MTINKLHWYCINNYIHLDIIREGFSQELRAICPDGVAFFIQFTESDDAVKEMYSILKKHMKRFYERPPRIYKQYIDYLEKQLLES